MEYKNDAVSSDFIIHQASSTTSRRFFRFLRTAVQIKCIIIYIATGFNSSSMSRTENTTNFLLMSTLDGLFKNVAQEPLVYFTNLCTTESLPSIPESTISKSERSGGSIFEKSDSGVMSLIA